jgi:hypothetical protein
VPESSIPRSRSKTLRSSAFYDTIASVILRTAGKALKRGRRHAHQWWAGRLPHFFDATSPTSFGRYEGTLKEREMSHRLLTVAGALALGYTPVALLRMPSIDSTEPWIWNVLAVWIASVCCFGYCCARHRRRPLFTTRRQTS